MDILLIILGVVLIIGGIIGSILPILPGPITGWAGLLVLSFVTYIDISWWVLGTTLFFAIAIFILDYIIPAMGTKKFGGSRYGMIGTTIGLIAGLIFFPPFGIVIGPFLGALAGELVYDSKDTQRATRAAFGSLLGFLTSTLIKFVTSFIFLGIFIYFLVFH